MVYVLVFFGVKQGEIVLIMLDNNIDVVVCWLVINKLCVVSVLINIVFKGEFLCYQIVDIGIYLVICEVDYLQCIVLLVSQFSEVICILYCGDLVVLVDCGILVVVLDEYCGDNESLFDIKLEFFDLVCLIYIFGIMGFLKGCMISYNFMCNLVCL